MNDYIVSLNNWPNWTRLKINQVLDLKTYTKHTGNHPLATTTIKITSNNNDEEENMTKMMVMIIFSTCTHLVAIW